jgi:hypothetical protein
MSFCSTCRYWKLADKEDYDEIRRPPDPDTYEDMEMPFEVGECRHPKLLFCERPLEPNGFAICDGSNYMANLYTAESFGCVRHEPKRKRRE